MGNKPNLAGLAGVLRGLTLYLYNFPEGDHDDPELYKTLYKRIHMILNPNLNFNRRDVQRGKISRCGYSTAELNCLIKKVQLNFCVIFCLFIYFCLRIQNGSVCSIVWWKGWQGRSSLVTEDWGQRKVFLPNRFTQNARQDAGSVSSPVDGVP